MRWALATAAAALLGWLAVEEMVVVVMVIDSSRGQGQAVFQRGRSNGRRCCAACCCHCSCVDGLHGPLDSAGAGPATHTYITTTRAQRFALPGHARGQVGDGEAPAASVLGSAPGRRGRRRVITTRERQQ